MVDKVKDRFDGDGEAGEGGGLLDKAKEAAADLKDKAGDMVDKAKDRVDGDK